MIKEFLAKLFKVDIRPRRSWNPFRHGFPPNLLEQMDTTPIATAPERYVGKRFEARGEIWEVESWVPDPGHSTGQDLDLDDGTMTAVRLETT